MFRKYVFLSSATALVLFCGLGCLELQWSAPELGSVDSRITNENPGRSRIDLTSRSFTSQYEARPSEILPANYSVLTSRQAPPRVDSHGPAYVPPTQPGSPQMISSSQSESPDFIPLQPDVDDARLPQAKTRETHASMLPIDESRTLSTRQPTQIRNADISRSQVVELDPGVQVPAALLESDESTPHGLAKAKEKVRAEFEREVSDAFADPAADTNSDSAAWNTARERADERFRLFFGDTAYNRESMRAAQEALDSAD